MLDASRLKTPKALIVSGIAAIAAAAVPVAAFAHHSYAMFDNTKTITLSGTIRTWEMTNPHSYLWIVVPKEGSAQPEIWGLEGGGIQSLQRAGITKSAVKPGEKVKVELNPLRDRRTGGRLKRITLADGRVIGGGGGAGAAPGAAALD